MQKVDLDSMSIDDLAKLRDQASEKLAEKVAARQLELAAEMEKLAAFGGGKKAKVVVPKKDLNNVKEALKPQLQEASKPQATKAA
ncbi:MAG: hypothetical protein Q7V17_03565 [Afipia sp.]|nr:hypothetical protein [Afipia sp.]